MLTPGSMEVTTLAEGWLPSGLYQCDECGEVRGTTYGGRDDGTVGPWKSTCLCEGLECKHCGERTIRRPISNYYHLADGRFWHVPYFMAMATCPRCGEKAAGVRRVRPEP